MNKYKDPKETWTRKEKIFENDRAGEIIWLSTPHGEVKCRACDGYKGWIAYLHIDKREHRGYGRTPDFAYKMASEDAQRQDDSDEFL